MTDELDPKASVTDDDVEGHGIEEIEEDDAADVAETLTMCGICTDA